jgi:hypothetical protein
VIACEKFHYAFLQKANHSNASYLKQLSVAQRDFYFNQALEEIFENLVKVPEIDSTIRNHLRQLERKSVVLSVEPRDGYVVAKYPADFYRRLRQTAIATKGGCGERELIIHVISSDKLTESLKSPNIKPSFEYEETLGDDGEEGLYVWHNGEFGISKVILDYIRKPAPILCPKLPGCEQYIDLMGSTITQNSDFEIDSTYLWRMIVDVAVLAAKRDHGDIANYQTQLNSIIFKQGEKLNQS